MKFAEREFTQNKSSIICKFAASMLEGRLYSETFAVAMPCRRRVLDGFSELRRQHLAIMNID